MRDDEKLRCVFNPEAQKAAEPYKVAGKIVGSVGTFTVVGLACLALVGRMPPIISLLLLADLTGIGYYVGGAIGEGIGKHLYYSRRESKKLLDDPSAYKP